MVGKICVDPANSGHDFLQSYKFFEDLKSNVTWSSSAKLVVFLNTYILLDHLKSNLFSCITQRPKYIIKFVFIGSSSVQTHAIPF